MLIIALSSHSWVAKKINTYYTLDLVVAPSLPARAAEAAFPKMEVLFSTVSYGSGMGAQGVPCPLGVRIPTGIWKMIFPDFKLGDV